MQFSWDPLCYSFCSLPLSLPLCCLSYPPLFPLIISYAILALQGSSHWSPSLSPPVLICYATAIPSHTSHWSPSAELYIPLSRLPPSLPPFPLLFDLILLLSEICFSLKRATEVFFICDAFISREHKGCAASGGGVRGQQPHFSPFRGNYSDSFTHTV